MTYTQETVRCYVTGTVWRVGNVPADMGPHPFAGMRCVLLRRVTDDAATDWLALVLLPWEQLEAHVVDCWGPAEPGHWRNVLCRDGHCVVEVQEDWLCPAGDTDVSCPVCGALCHSVRPQPGGCTLFCHDDTGHLVEA